MEIYRYGSRVTLNGLGREIFDFIGVCRTGDVVAPQLVIQKAKMVKA